jgi:putative transposase
LDFGTLSRLKELEWENTRLKRMFADLSHEHRIVKDVIKKKAVKPCQKKELVAKIVQDSNISAVRPRKIVDLDSNFSPQKYFPLARLLSRALRTAP